MSPPPSYPIPISDKDTSLGFKLSVGFHTALIVIILVKSFVFVGKPTPLVPTLRVDLVGLPDLLKQDLTKIHKQPVAEPDSETKAPALPPIEKADPKEMVLKPVPLIKTLNNKANAKKNEKQRNKKLMSALDRIKALQKIESEVEEQPKQLKGNKVSQGTSVSADAVESDLSNYYDTLRDQLQSNWELPVWIARQNLSAQVQIFIDAHGHLHEFRFTRPSGNAQFDDAVKKALSQSQPFAAPPSDIAQSVLVDGVLVGFPL